VGVKVKYDTISLINRLRDANPDRFRGRQVRDDVEIYITRTAICTSDDADRERAHARISCGNSPARAELCMNGYIACSPATAHSQPFVHPTGRSVRGTVVMPAATPVRRNFLREWITRFISHFK
jgi:hypothetical protein